MSYCCKSRIEEDYLKKTKYDFKAMPYMTANDLRGMYAMNTGSGAMNMNPADGMSGGFMPSVYKKMGPDDKVGYAPGTANSGLPMLTQMFAQDYSIAAAKAAEKYDRLIHAMNNND
jgi:hypothetical protein